MLEMEQSGSVPRFSARFIWTVFSKSGYFWGSAFIFGFGVYNLISVWMAAIEHDSLSGVVAEALIAFTLLFALAESWLIVDLYQICRQVECAVDEAKRGLLRDSAYRTVRMFYVAGALSIFALLLCPR